MTSGSFWLIKIVLDLKMYFNAETKNGAKVTQHIKWRRRGLVVRVQILLPASR